jgi:hypothetical protein
MEYNIAFISFDDLYNHVKETVQKYRTSINFNEFTKNILDPVKMTFDSKVYGKSIEDVIDKSNTNHIGYFHQNIFKYVGGNDWTVPEHGFDIINEDRMVYVEMKNKHNTMNSSSSKSTYIKMLDQLVDKPESTCMLVEVIAKKSQNIEWRVSID